MDCLILCIDTYYALILCIETYTILIHKYYALILCIDCTHCMLYHTRMVFTILNQLLGGSSCLC